MVSPRRRTTCRACGHAGFAPVLSLGTQSLTSFPLPGQPTRRGPLEAVLCKRCKLFQMRWTYPGSWLYSWYGYRSGVNPIMVRALRDMAERVVELARPQPGTGWSKLCGMQWVLDIGSNDGTYLRMMPEGVGRVGFEPARNLQPQAREGLTLLVDDYFSVSPLRKWISGYGKAKVVTALAMFYDLDRPAAFLRDVARVLREDGVLVIQMNYLPAVLRDCAVDNLSHEHVTIYSLSTLLPVLQAAGFSAWDAEENDVNGGSFRIWCRPAAFSGPYDPHDAAWAASGRVRIQEMLDREAAQGVGRLDTYVAWARRVVSARNAIRAGVLDRAKAGKIIYALGASTRGLVLLEYCGLGRDIICGASERNPDKWGRTYGGTGIPCVPEAEAREKADCMLVLPWHFLPEITVRERSFLGRGGELLVPLPVFRSIRGGP